MKRGTETLLKFRKLQAAMGLPTWQIKGLLQSIWDFTADNAVAGDIGRHSDADIAFGIDYQGDAEALVAALVSTGWLDTHPEHRLVVHDWADHCEEYIRKRLARNGLQFAVLSDNGGQRPTESATVRQRQTLSDNGRQRQTLSASRARGAKPSPANPSQAEPSPAKTIQAKPMPSQAEPMPLGSALGVFRADQEGTVRSVVDRAVTATHRPDAREWHTAVATALWQAGFPEYCEAVEYVEDCADPATRRAKDLGELKEPHKWLLKKATQICKQHGVRWPAFPEECTA